MYNEVVYQGLYAKRQNAQCGVGDWTDHRMVRFFFSLHIAPVHCRKHKLTWGIFITTKLKHLIWKGEVLLTSQSHTAWSWKLSNSCGTLCTTVAIPSSTFDITAWRSKWEVDPIQTDGDGVGKNCPCTGETGPQDWLNENNEINKLLKEKYSALVEWWNDVTLQSKKDCFRYQKSKAQRELWKIQDSWLDNKAGKSRNLLTPLTLRCFSTP